MEVVEQLRRLAGGKRLGVLVSLGLIGVAVATGTRLGATDGRAVGPVQKRSQLEIQKLEQEVRKLRIENDHAQGFTSDLFRWGAFIAVVGGVATVLVGA